MIQYRALFANAWRNKLMLAEAALFTGLFWLLLFLRQMLFHKLGNRLLPGIVPWWRARLHPAQKLTLVALI
jgi:hypothetical protein